jgi:uncharacterized protein YegP (UPF0339 family)
MATATQKSRTAKREARAPVAEPMEFLVSEENGGSYRWMIVAGNGTTLARSGRFASRADAEQAAQRVRDGAATARFKRRATAAPPIDLNARREAARDDAAAERWLDDSDSFDDSESFSSETVPTWPASR